MPIKAATSKDSVAVHLRISDNPKMATLISNVLAFLLLAAAIVSGLPAPDESKISTDINEENSTLILDLVPPIEGEDDNGRNVTLFIINLYAIRNHSGESSEEMLDNNVVQKMPDIIGPLATLFLVVEEGGDEEPVDLDKMAKYMEEHGLKTDKIDESGETSVLKTEIPEKDIDDVKEMLESTADNYSTSDKLSKSKKYRAKRMACHKCHGGGGRGGGGKGGGGGGGQIGVIPVYVVPVAIQQQPQYHPPPQQYHPPPQQYHPQPVCDPCQGRGGGGGGRGGGGGGIAYAQASAQASAGGGGW
ncbi:PREDICTED: uncharacterized protein LOC106785742 isoform X2 [Polistes canadensis]|uniref:uncharacterized protein LOC106785742 isoform X2 n=1 Tax=Polistes canadensis TaxID=91411 RepID=UPI000718F224|nr:PREDICTED: uncharacterized protein LOC106785742 isoform X2 [Polistes canadensis]